MSPEPSTVCRTDEFNEGLRIVLGVLDPIHLCISIPYIAVDLSKFYDPPVQCVVRRLSRMINTRKPLPLGLPLNLYVDLFCRPAFDLNDAAYRLPQ